MGAPRSEDVWVEVVAMIPRISGVVHSAADPDAAFDGWLELMSLLDKKDVASESD